MKKTIAMLLVAVMAFTAVFVLAEEAPVTEENFSTYFMAGVVDPEGNTVTYTDSDAFPVLVFSVSDEADADGVMICYFGTEEELYEGACAITEQTEETVTLYVLLTTGEELSLLYTVADDAFAYVDAEGYTFVLMNAETLESDSASVEAAA